MLRRMYSGIVLSVLLVGVLVAFNIHSVKALSTIYIRADGSIDPPTAPITRNGDLYTLTGNISAETDGIVIEKNNVVLDGAGYTLLGNVDYTGMLLSGRNNVTIFNIEIEGFFFAIYLNSSSYNRIVGNNIANGNAYGIFLNYSSNNNVSSNNIANNGWGIILDYSSNNNSVCDNNIAANNIFGIALAHSSSNNSIIGNNITANGWAGVNLSNSSNNVIYYNNFINNTNQVYTSNSANVWDGSYPSGGNHWTNYNGTDSFSGIYQNMTGIDGIGDTPYVISANNSDRYPFMGPLARATTGLNMTVYPEPDVGLTFANLTRTGFASAYKTDTLPGWMPSIPGLVGRYVDVTVTAGSYGKITVAVSYDDTNMTEAEENSLRLLQWKGCDVTGPTPGVLDGVVNMRDIGAFASKFLVPGGSDAWDPRYDVTGPTPGVPDGIVNMRDIGYACSNFMGTNHWVSITTYVDTVNNIIYGETTHFSMFGVTRE